MVRVERRVRVYALCFTLDLKRRFMTPFDLLSAVLSEVPLTDMLLLSLLDLEDSTSSAPPATTRDKPASNNHPSVFYILFPASQEGSSCFFLLFFLRGGDPAAA